MMMPNSSMDVRGQERVSLRPQSLSQLPFIKFFRLEKCGQWTLNFAYGQECVEITFTLMYVDLFLPAAMANSCFVTSLNEMKTNKSNIMDRHLCICMLNEQCLTWKKITTLRSINKHVAPSTFVMKVCHSNSTLIFWWCMFWSASLNVFP